jgi:hypothetical protein
MSCSAVVPNYLQWRGSGSSVCLLFRGAQLCRQFDHLNGQYRFYLQLYPFTFESMNKK